MKKTIKLVVANLFALAFVWTGPQKASAQSTIEYGKQAGGIKSPAVGKASAKTRGKTGKANQGGEAEPAEFVPLPGSLSVKGEQAILRARQDENSETLEKMEKGEKLVPMAQSAGFEKWYMVKSQKGMVGWIKAGDVDESR
ncbi:MAG: hypothetical protein ACREQK_06710 [Candidatus Binatia bacterium]